MSCDFPISALLICLIISLALAPCIRDHKQPLASSGVRGPRNLAAASHPGGRRYSANGGAADRKRSDRNERRHALRKLASVGSSLQSWWICCAVCAESLHCKHTKTVLIFSPLSDSCYVIHYVKKNKTKEKTKQKHIAGPMHSLDLFLSFLVFADVFTQLNFIFCSPHTGYFILQHQYCRKWKPSRIRLSQLYSPLKFFQ